MTVLLTITFVGLSILDNLRRVAWRKHKPIKKAAERFAPIKLDQPPMEKETPSIIEELDDEILFLWFDDD